MQTDVQGQAVIGQGATALEYSKEDMRAQVEAIVADPKHVRINWKRLDQVAAIAPASVASRWIDAYRETEEHYREPFPVELSELDRLQLAAVGASQGWLIWQREPDGGVVPFTVHADGKKYVGPNALSACHARALRRGQNILDPAVLASFTLQDVEGHYRDEVTGRVTLQLLEDRLENFREVGQVLLDEFDGHFVNVLKRADRYLYRDDGQGLVQLLVTRFPKTFGDWPLSKLPNVLPLGLYDQRVTFGPEIAGLLDFKDLENIEGGSDYYRPYFFIRVGLFDVTEELKQKLRRRELIEAGSQMEREYRAFTHVAMRELSARAGGWPSALPDLEVETHAQAFLRCRRCRVGISDEELPCAYRPVCKATHEDHELMDGIWPLVVTTEY